MLPIIKRAADKAGSVIALAEICDCTRQNIYQIKVLSPKIARGVAGVLGLPLWKVAPDIWQKPGRRE